LNIPYRQCYSMLRFRRSSLPPFRQSEKLRETAANRANRKVRPYRRVQVRSNGREPVRSSNRIERYSPEARHPSNKTIRANHGKGVSGSFHRCANVTNAEMCSKPLGNTAQGLCDMGGNVWEWVEDDWHDTYIDAPSNGLARIDSPRSNARVLRGG